MRARPVVGAVRRTWAGELRADAVGDVDTRCGREDEDREEAAPHRRGVYIERSMVGYRLLDYEGAGMEELPSRPRRPRFVLTSVLASGLLSFFCVERDAEAQLHWDASAQLGVMKRFLANRPASTDDVGFGATGQLTGHVALLPLVHVGGYFGHDISPLPGDGAARNITFGGVRVKGLIPWFRGAARAWIFAGFGYAGVYSQSYDTTFTFVDGAGIATRRPVHVQGAGGSFFDVPFGIGASYKLFKPWELCAELGGRFGFGHTGSVYEPPGPQVRVEGLPGQNALPAGLDRFALGLTVGVMIDL